MKIEGIDPGSKGALAFIDPEAGTLRVYDLPTTTYTGGSRKQTKADPLAMKTIIEAEKPIHAWIEDVHSSPQMGVVSAFSFGRNLGDVEAAHIVLLIPVSFVSPNLWKASLKVPADKKEAVARANQLMPACSVLFTRPDRAESALIAFYGCLALGHKIMKKIVPIM